MKGTDCKRRCLSRIGQGSDLYSRLGRETYLRPMESN